MSKHRQTNGVGAATFAKPDLAPPAPNWISAQGKTGSDPNREKTPNCHETN